ncbi:MAG: Hpt domain-containing protein [Lachnospiraceae bacterium]|nr:Hpt domain-containing protein [Lachnospiraceae bacterium]
MTVQELYTELGGNYDDIMRRLRSERIARKFLLRFLEDKTFETLQQAVENGQQEEAFRAAHTLKGLSLNMGFPQLLDSSQKLTESVRTELTPEAASLLQTVAADYARTVEAIQALDAE